MVVLSVLVLLAFLGNKKVRGEGGREREGGREGVEKERGMRKE